ncbi:helix-turn-helix domain-containing protein [Belnapia sp. T18]|uniref:Helix-turn-helix domain-containing protein n=1 Tax=Belnapia arida TaxID=2804533 RepID=A0ABS1U7K8_9PROT|nr:helix-turn-helix domain-containing protein [Belnapia arida]MBL6079702.1 helix-turn-helix domain-containing protein [Belnapia arida]
MQLRPAEPHQRQPSSLQPPLTHTLNNAAHITGLSRSTLYRHAHAGRLRLVRVGGRTLVDAASLRALVGAEP